MAGERSAYFVEMAERAAGRVVDRLVMIADRYSPPVNPADDVITFAEMMQHYVDYGHNAPDENCAHPFCERARRMIAGALKVMSQPTQPQGGQ